MRVNKVFFDTNVLLYLLSADTKADKAEALIAQGGIISVQVLNEFASVAFRKLKMTWSEIQEILKSVRAICEIVPVTLEIHEAGLAIAEKYRLSLYDGLILATAIKAQCHTVYSEDMQHGYALESLMICNPF